MNEAYAAFDTRGARTNAIGRKELNRMTSSKRLVETMANTAGIATAVVASSAPPPPSSDAGNVSGGGATAKVAEAQERRVVSSSNEGGQDRQVLIGTSISLTLVYRADGHLVDLGFICFLTRYCFVCHILLGQV